MANLSDRDKQFCKCIRRCRGGKWVAKSTFHLHRKETLAASTQQGPPSQAGSSASSNNHTETAANANGKRVHTDAQTGASRKRTHRSSTQQQNASPAGSQSQSADQTPLYVSYMHHFDTF